MNVTALIAARMGSSRFPGKTLADLHGKPMLQRMVERIRAARGVDNIVLATTDLAGDDTLAQWAELVGIRCFRGSATDVLGRLHAAAEAYQMETIVEMLGDNPLVHSSLIEAALACYCGGGLDYVATVTNEYPMAPSELRRFPIGIRVQVFGIETIRRCAELAYAPENREHATSFIASHPDRFSTAFVDATGEFANLHRPELTFAVNHRQNLELIRAIFARCYDTDNNFSISTAIATFDADPMLASLMGEPREHVSQ